MHIYIHTYIIIYIYIYIYVHIQTLYTWWNFKIQKWQCFVEHIKCHRSHGPAMTCCFSWFWPSKPPENLNALRQVGHSLWIETIKKPNQTPEKSKRHLNIAKTIGLAWDVLAFRTTICVLLGHVTAQWSRPNSVKGKVLPSFWLICGLHI